jgi:hypothetical protein
MEEELKKKTMCLVLLALNPPQSLGNQLKAGALPANQRQKG